MAVSEVAFGYALSLTKQVNAIKGNGAEDSLVLLHDLAAMDASALSFRIDTLQAVIAGAKKQGVNTHATLGDFAAAPAYVPPAGQYMINGEHYTIKKSKIHGGMLVYKGEWGGYVGALAGPKCTVIAEALSSADKAQAACIAYAKVTGKCGVCNTKLTDPKSIAAGIGPVCAKKYT